MEVYLSDKISTYFHKNNIDIDRSSCILSFCNLKEYVAY